VHGAKLVTKEEKERLDEWYVRNASILVDLQITAMTIVLLLKSRTLSAEIAADADQVQSKNLKLEHAAATASKPNQKTLQ
jgi:lipopolysaccharide/colanic/teichoic acid biosynthesis glycosyltransferase